MPVEISTSSLISNTLGGASKEYAVMEAEMERLGIPIIRVETDYNEEDVEQLRIRIEAFIELIKYGGNDT